MKERAMTADALKYVRDVLKQTAAVEVKVAKGRSIPFDALAEHQERALLLANTTCIYHKISDTGAMYGELPFDGFVLCNVPAYVSVIWPRKGTTLIRISDWISERDISERKSLTFERASEIAYKTYKK